MQRLDWLLGRCRRSHAGATQRGRIYAPGEAPQSLGTVPTRLSGPPSMFAAAPPDQVIALPNPLDDLPPARRRAVRAVLDASFQSHHRQQQENAR